MIDTHCHLTDPRLRDQLQAVLIRAKLAGVNQLISIGTSLQDSIDTVELCQTLSNVYCAVGIHPNYTGKAQPEDLSPIRGLQANPCVVAMGEMGLDYHYDFSDKATQRTFFENQLATAAEFDRPVVVHCREAVDDTLAILGLFPGVRAVFHCFTGTSDEAKRISAKGYYLGFTGPVTYKKSDDLRLSAAKCPPDQIVVETDAPYLSPEPVRANKVNEPANVMHTARRIAEIRGMRLEELDQVTTANALRFFGFSKIS